MSEDSPASRRPVARTLFMLCSGAYVGLIAGVLVGVIMVFSFNARQAINEARWRLHEGSSDVNAPEPPPLSAEQEQAVRKLSNAQTGRVTGKMFVTLDYAGLGLLGIMWLTGLPTWWRMGSRNARYASVLLMILLTASVVVLAFLFTPTINNLNEAALTTTAPEHVARARDTINQLHPWASRLVYLNVACLLTLFLIAGLAKPRKD